MRLMLFVLSVPVETWGLCTKFQQLIFLNGIAQIKTLIGDISGDGEVEQSTFTSLVNQHGISMSNLNLGLPGKFRIEIQGMNLLDIESLAGFQIFQSDFSQIGN